MGEKPPRLFLDASVIIAASAAPEGGSALVLDYCRVGKAKALVTRLVLREAERNIREKLGEAVLLRFYHLIVAMDPTVVPAPSPAQMEAAIRIVAPKDAHVLAAAQAAHATHLITLDRRHFLGEEQRKAILPIIACTPGEYLQALLSR